MNCISIILCTNLPLVRYVIGVIVDQASDLSLLSSIENASEVRMLRDHKPEVILIAQDPHGGWSLCDAVQDVHRDCSSAKLIVLLEGNEALCMTSLLNSAISGGMLTSEVNDSLCYMIRAVAQGEKWFSHAAITNLAYGSPSLPTGPAETQLTERESEVLGLLQQGQSNTQIATLLNLKEQSVRNYVSRIYAKLGVSSRAAAIACGQNQAQHGYSLKNIQT